LIKWNPAVKTANDRKVLWEALLDDRIDVIAHRSKLLTLLEGETTVVPESTSGGPLECITVVAMFERIIKEKLVKRLLKNVSQSNQNI
jgi:dihydroorotase